MTSLESEAETAYLQIARFSGERPAGRAYKLLQVSIFRSPGCDLSVFRFVLRRDWHVAALGEQPDEMLDRRIRQILSRGVPVSISGEILTELQRRRAEATKIGPWVERHYQTPP